MVLGYTAMNVAGCIKTYRAFKLPMRIYINTHRNRCDTIVLYSILNSDPQ